MYSKSADTISMILKAARKHFLSRNYADVTMVEIAEAARVTKGALYHHFDSKEALYLEMMNADLREKQALFRRVVETDGPCRERLRQLTVTFLELPNEKQGLMNLVRRDVNIFKNPSRRKLIRSYQAALPQQVEAIIRDGIRGGELAPGDPRLLAWEYTAMVEVVLSRYARQVLGSHECMADYVLSLFFSGAGGNVKRQT